jgi:hypothetical protein
MTSKVSRWAQAAQAIARLLEAIRSLIPNRKAPPAPVDPPRPPDVDTQPTDVPPSPPTEVRR